ncbi:ectoine/hydroxyectoine ABC transporter permease subunit EhuC [Mesorhizobium sp. M1A.F.Ca.IN.022.07.1.1]|uniref:ectoine/hydroxyectoine ABC transporter permease subunit EhuC n=1 Tax=unclassified Mesorhizobium TaxID=325217 RepID=UPI000FCB4C73|nr:MULTISPECIES: ectoine/hydroxyectoine ABC transporter permease subunit EhuC [unclassified Mesorhizobium]RUV95195.1 ectoine/hydroxyectoine ABC transporter permease subunit EhuC [Mesorhizobium sp. M1A.F.Ca.IN.022.07.1.1]RWM65121.1 MAG: ectoine/hydroxyectoine ABC transporter permease subunit EhuC [Mesorhizobium sp.]RWM89596.1 MAG: ectoine/hydroxyectoine ABC transporter permease subunit EhuC [Mesorhizobium sp.]TIS71602.1 MAG: ectoine/hydroxyectoine ABC transporter permease subunit EhuC [Mesorhizo
MPDSVQFLPLILAGAILSLELMVLGSLLALLVAFTVGFARLANTPLARVPARVFMEFFRGTSLFVQLFWAYFVLPLFGISLTPFQAGVICLGLNAGAYMSEIVRGAVLALPREQFEACIALNLRKGHRLRYVLMPQALRLMIPPFSNSIVEVLKGTSIVSLISLSDMTFRAQSVRVQTGETAIPFVTILLVYFLLSLGFWSLTRRLERNLAPLHSTERTT